MLFYFKKLNIIMKTYILYLGISPLISYGSNIEDVIEIYKEDGICAQRFIISLEQDGPKNVPLLMLRIDPSTNFISLKHALNQEDWKTAQEWSLEAKCVPTFGAISIAKFSAEGNSIGYMKADDGHILNSNSKDSWGGILALNPYDEKDKQVQIFHLEISTLAEIERRYKTVIQLERLLNQKCEPINWAYATPHSIAAVGVDKNNHLVFIFSEIQVSAGHLAKMVSIPELNLLGALYAVGGASAGIYANLNSQLISNQGLLTAPAKLNFISSLLKYVSPNLLGKGSFPFALCFESN